MQDNLLKKRDIELLAPAGNFDALKAAISSGANAVYCGLNKFSARAKADNFSINNIEQTLEYTHLFNVKVYVAMNTLLYQNELGQALDLAKQLHKFKVDALIVQDLGFACVLKKEIPSLVLHASTQMGIHNLEGVLAAKKLGIERVVLSRETTIEDIKKIKDNCDIELEYFCHGALCVGFSGNCYLCSLLMRQSGNRGRCLQLCRKKYELRGKKGYWLSAKDLMMANKLKELADAGIDSFKIEGRMRRTKYTEVATGVYRKIIDNGFIFNKEDRLELDSVYLRDGGTEGFLFNANAKTICDLDRGHVGVSNIDESTSFDPKLKVDAECILRVGEKVKLVLEYGDVRVEVFGDEVKASISSPLNEDKIRKNILKMGMTEFIVDNMDIKMDNDAFMAVSMINDLRRRGINVLKEKILKNYNVKTSKRENILFDIKSDIKSALRHYKKVAMVDTLEKFKLIKDGVDCLIFSPFKYDKHDIESLVDALEIPVYLNLPIIARHSDIKLLNQILLSDKIKNVVANNLYALELAKDKNVMLGLGLNLINNTFKNYNRILSLESKGEFLNSDIVYAFGIPQLMIFCHCFSKNCHTCNANNALLKDEIGASFMIKKTKLVNCYHSLFNNIPVNATAALESRNALCGKLFDFTAIKISDLKNFDYNNFNNIFPKFTKGHLYRGVE
ncbi:MAG: U32 family peptidase [Firmicutes bacterium]|nr:U32 family peptidase [Bacillota bacterium]